jgi:hypothetical protein
MIRKGAEQLALAERTSAAGAAKSRG